jgi:alkanesulfonate monooxygenase SsuD/methylene tetrahydromethanopterin reductase-like flavin-dependent oxidoreductase (luciferase family)
MSTLKFGLALPYTGARAIANLAQLAEESGWDGVFVGDAVWCEDPMISLTAAAMVTQRIRLGTLITPVPLRKPWKIASESIALERLSNGRLTLGLGTGAVWMGWQAFPDETSDAKSRAEMLDETIEILTLLYQRKQFDYEGKHYHLKLTELDEQYYPPRPIQQPGIPLWAVGLWPRVRSIRRALKCDGIIVEKINSEGTGEEATPADIRELRGFVEANRALSTPFEIVMSGQTSALEPDRAKEKFAGLAEAGLTWWVEGFWGDAEEKVADYIKQGPPKLV